MSHFEIAKAFEPMLWSLFFAMAKSIYWEVASATAALIYNYRKGA